jgi:hypothetical protein
VISIGRVTINIIVLTILISLSTLYIAKEFTLSEDKKREFTEREDKIYGWVFFTMFLLLATVICILIYRLRIKDLYMKNETAVYRNEKRMLRITLIVYSSAYLLRWIYDVGYFTGSQKNWKHFR